MTTAARRVANIWSRSAWPSVPLIAAFAVLDLCVGSLMNALDRADLPYLMFVLAGCVAAQAPLLSAWLVWGNGPLWRRLAFHFSVAGVLATFGLIGMLPVVYPSEGVQGPLMVGLSLPTVSVAVSAPLWAMRVFFGWRIVREEQMAVPDVRITIVEFFIGMTIVAVALTIARLGMEVGDLPRPEEYWVAIGAISGAAMAAAALLELPGVWIAMRLRPAASALAVGAIMSLPWLVIVIFWTVAEGRIPDGRFVAAGFLLLQSFGFTTAAAFWIARAAGYRLVTGTMGNDQTTKPQ